MARRVRPGEKLNITAAEYNRLLAAADAIARDRLSGGGGNRTHVRDAATVRVHYQSATTVPIGGIVGFNAPLGDPDVDNTALARFVRDATIQSVASNRRRTHRSIRCGHRADRRGQSRSRGIRRRGRCPCECSRDLASICRCRELRRNDSPIEAQRIGSNPVAT